MQQTETYQLNLIDPSDDFSPEPLNANARAIETALKNVAATVGSAGHTCRVDSGSYTGAGVYGAAHQNSLTFSIRPMLVIVTDPAAYRYVVFMRPTATTYPVGTNTLAVLAVSWSDKGISWYTENSLADSATKFQFNVKDTQYRYVVFGYDE